MGSNPAQGIKSFSSNENVIQKVVHPWSLIISLSLSLSLSLDVKFTTFVTFHLQQYNLIVDTFNQKVITFQALVECEEALLLIWLY